MSNQTGDILILIFGPPLGFALAAIISRFTK